MSKHTPRRILSPLLAISLLGALVALSAPARAQDPQPAAITFKVQRATERMEMTVNTSRILTLDQKIWKAQVNNRDILEQTPLSPTQVQVYAKKPGVTQVNLFSEDERVFTVDVIVYADAKELEELLKAQFPNATLKVVPVGSNVLISGYVDHPEHARLITRIAEEYYPKVIDNLTISGVQQVLLHVKVMEVSRTKLRNLGFDFSNISGNNFIVSGVSGLITAAATATGATTAAGLPATSAGGPSFLFNVIDGGGAFFGVLEALRQDNLMKVLAEPALVTVSGRPARFQSGGEFPILVPQSLGTISIEYKSYGTQLDFVPIVLGDGRIRLEVRPRVSELDYAQSVTSGGITVPGLRTREVETGVEMQAGQTLAIAGLVQSRVEAETKGLPLVSEVPYVGALFRRVHHQRNDIELLILVTPELVDAMDANEVPPCGPGMQTTDPDDFDLYMKGHLEVPNCCPPGCETGAGQAAGGMMMPQGGMIEGMIIEGSTPVAAPRQGSIARPDISQNRYYSPNTPVRPAESRPVAEKTAPALIGPIGYDVLE